MEDLGAEIRESLDAKLQSIFNGREEYERRQSINDLLNQSTALLIL